MLLMVSFKGNASFEGLKKKNSFGMVKEVNGFQLVTEKRFVNLEKIVINVV